MVNQTKQRNLRRSTSKKTKSRTRKHVNRRVSRSNKMRGGGEKIELVLKTRKTVHDPYVFICNDTTENGVNIGFTIGKEYTLITGEFPLKGMAENTRSDNEYKTADENIINNVYTFRDTNKTLITDIRIKNYKDYCRNFRLNTGGICSITVAQELIQLKVRGKNLFECIETTDNGTKIGFSKDKIYSIEGGIGFHIYYPYFVLSPELKVSWGLSNLHSRDPSLIFSSNFDKIYSRMISFSLIVE